MRCVNCLRSHSGAHPFMCGGCLEALRKRGVRASGLFKVRTQWWRA